MKPSMLSVAVPLILFLAALFAGCVGKAPSPNVAVTEEPQPLPEGATETGSAIVAVAAGGHMPTFWYKPAGASAESAVPVILILHGGSGSHDDETSVRFRTAFLGAGYGVVAVDQRGHGANLDPIPDDFMLWVDDLVPVVDWIHDELSWVARQPGSGIEKDIRIGVYGYSLGGLQQHLAARDPRIDALVPMDAWTNFWDVFYPRGVVDSFWTAGFLAAFGSNTVGSDPPGNVRMGPGWDAAFAEALATNHWPATRIAMAKRLDVADFITTLTVPTLYIHGVSDTTWPLWETVENFDALRRAGTPTQLITFLGGHRRPTGNAPETPVGDAFEAFPCGRNEDHAIAWYDEWLRGVPQEPSAPIRMALEDGACVSLDAFPSSTKVTPSQASAQLLGVAGTADVVLMDPGAQRRLAGQTILHIDSVDSAADDVIFFVSLRRGSDLPGEAMSDQITPVRLAAGNRTNIEVPLYVVGGFVPATETSVLHLERQNPWYATAGSPSPLPITFSGLRVELPILE